MTDVEAYERKRIKDMIRDMIRKELTVDVYNSYDGVKIRLLLGGEEFWNEIFDQDIFSNE